MMGMQRRLLQDNIVHLCTDTSVDTNQHSSLFPSVWIYASWMSVRFVHYQWFIGKWKKRWHWFLKFEPESNIKTPENHHALI
ncbi:hypothetical protein T05_15618 [Trichinella murrelli]|uniref:Uncharacterized protein n=1 Tax=Trichinella murrelli TaxID=144512 RepID=A0A0V0TLA7_9BILA|nr:hypothetical protein T05_15618 [Trichinella murrelli]